jgi:hypothetical protein
MSGTRRSLYELPGYAERGGYVYALLFTTEVVEVGRTADARAEVTARRKTARALGVDLADWWVSVPHAEWIVNERALAETARALGGRRTGSGCYAGANFEVLTGKAHDLPVTSTAAYAYGRRRQSRTTAQERDKRMAITAGYRAGGLTVREIAAQLAVSHTTVENDLARWGQVRDSVPPEIARLSRPVGKSTRQTSPPDDACLPGEVASVASVLPFRRSA